MSVDYDKLNELCEKKEKHKIAYVENGIGYFYENDLPKCGCGGKAMANYHLVGGERFGDVEIYCQECGISTGVCKTADEAITKWMNAFKIIDDLKKKLEHATQYEDHICLSRSGSFCEGD